MEAKDTVMDEGQISDAKKGHTAIIQTHPSVYESDYAITQVQAEISFRAGREQELLEAKEAMITMGKRAMDEAYKAGIREVVEWIGDNVPEGYDQRGIEPPLYLLYIDKEQWQAKLKEWEEHSDTTKENPKTTG